MKKLFNNSKVLNGIIAMIMLLFFQSTLIAQEKDVEVDLNVNKGVTTTTWYEEPWMWVVGGAVFLIIIIALVRGKK
ncbi:MAG: hypothetical protein V4548_08470 [Bacteroidota bacterium]